MSDANVDNHQPHENEDMPLLNDVTPLGNLYEPEEEPILLPFLVPTKSSANLNNHEDEAMPALVHRGYESDDDDDATPVCRDYVYKPDNQEEKEHNLNQDDDESNHNEEVDEPNPNEPNLAITNIMAKGLLLLGFDSGRQARVILRTNIERFKSRYGASPTTVYDIVTSLEAKYELPPRPHCLQWVLLALNWMKTDDTEPILAGRFTMCERTIRRRSKGTAELIAGLYEDKIAFVHKEGEKIAFSVDGVNCTTFEFGKDPSAKYYDHKSDSAGVKYEVAMSIRQPKIVWTNGPVPASVHDITLFRGGKSDQSPTQWNQQSLYFQHPYGTKFVGDSGYGGEPTKILVKKREHSQELKQFIERALSRHETVNKRFKTFNILKNRFHHGKGTNDRMRLHKVVFRAIVVVVQMEFDNGRHVFEV